MARKRLNTPIKRDNVMRIKLWLAIGVLFLLFSLPIGRLIMIHYQDGEKYEKRVLELQTYSSTDIPFQRGDIVDRTGTVLATSVPVYNVVLDCSVMTSKEEYIEPTIAALCECFPDLERFKLEDYAKNRKDQKYIVLLKKLSYDEISPYIEMRDALDEKQKKVNPNLKGVWFETEYKRVYPYDYLASSVIGFTSAGNVGTIGLEYFYNDTLNGIDGREYGYLNEDYNVERTVVPAQNGDTLITTLDINIQSIVEEKILEFNETYRDNYREGAGSTNTAVIIMNPKNGEILAMADYPSVNLNEPRNLELYYPDEDVDKLTDEEQYKKLNALWKNYCVTHTYEPGSVQKPLTVACGLENGSLDTEASYLCDGYELVNGQKISCVNRNGHGSVSLESALMVSCNDALMQMGNQIGVEDFLDYQDIFGFGLKTGIDLPGEANTSKLVYSKETIGKVDFATNVFGQNYNCTMVQMVSAFSSLVNGGQYYQPHIVKKVTDASGNTLSNVEGTLMKQTVSDSTSTLLKDYLYSVVTSGTASTAKVDGYSMGGKTGTAQKLPRGDGNYLVSFIGCIPYDDPELVIYCIVDEPNVEDQAHSYFAQNIVREILEEVLPYMNIYPDEELTGMNATLGITGTDYQFHINSSEEHAEGEEPEAQEGEGNPEGENNPEGEDNPEDTNE